MTDQMSATQPQVTAALTNADGTPNVYLTTDPTTNALTLTVTNGLSVPVVFPAGTPVAYEDLPAGQSAVYIFFPSTLFDSAGNADIANIKLSAPGWASGTFLFPADGLQYLVIAPDSQVTVQPGGTLSFTLTNVLVPGTQRSGYADISLAGATGLTALQSEVPLWVNIASPPQPGNQALDLQIGFDTPALYAGCAQSQSLTLHLINNDKNKPLVPGGTSAWGGTTPTFELTFLCGDQPDDLTSVELGAQIAVNVGNAYGNVWQPPLPDTQGASPSWKLQPDPNGGGTVLGTGEQGIIEFDITGIFATLPAGLDSALTIAYVSWYDIPGYNDGSTALLITKVAGPRIVSFTAEPQSGYCAVQTVLAWVAEYTDHVTFTGPGMPAGFYESSGSGPLPGGVSVPVGTKLTLTAWPLPLPAARALPGERPRLAGDEPVSASKDLVITGATRTDVPAGIGLLGNIVLPAGSASGFVFQGNIGVSWFDLVTRVAVLDLASDAMTGTVVDLGPLLPLPRDKSMIAGAVPSPDGTMIHVLTWLGLIIKNQSASFTSPPIQVVELPYYIAPFDVASLSYGTGATLSLDWTPRAGQPGGLELPTAPGGSAGLPYAPGGPEESERLGALLATPDGSTVYVSLWDDQFGLATLYALDAATYAVKGSWDLKALEDQHDLSPATPVASNADGSVLLMSADGGLMVVGVAAGGLTLVSTLGFGGLVAGPLAVSPDGTRGYCIGTPDPASSQDQDPISATLLAFDIDLAAGSVSLANQYPFGPVPNIVGPVAVSCEGKTLYTLVNADIVAAFDTTTLAPTLYTCGTNGDFTPVLIVPSGTHPNVLYCTGASQQDNGTVSVITIY